MNRISISHWNTAKQFLNNNINRIFHPILQNTIRKETLLLFYLTFQVTWKALFPRSQIPTENHIVPASINSNEEKLSWRHELFLFPLK